MKMLDSRLAESIGASGARLEGRDGGALHIVTAGGSAIAWPRPGGIDPSGPEYALAAKAARAFAEAHGAIARIVADARLNDVAKTADAAEAARKAHAAFADIERDAAAIIERFEAADHAEARAPDLAASDLAGALGDYEVREWIRGMDAQARVEWVRQVASGDARAIRQAHAVLRGLADDLRDGVLGAGLDAALAEAEALRDPRTARMRREARERIEFLRIVVAQVRSGLPRVSRTVDDERRAALAHRAA